MNTNPDETKARADSWAHPAGRLKVTDRQVPAAGYNIQGRQVASPLQGFGQLWRKAYRIRLTNSQATSFEAMQNWKDHFPRFQPPENHF